MCVKNVNETSSESGYSSEEDIFLGNYCDLCRKIISGPRTALLAHLGTIHTDVPLQKLGEKVRMSELHIIVKVRKLAIQRFLKQ